MQGSLQVAVRTAGGPLHTLHERFSAAVAEPVDFAALRPADHPPVAVARAIAAWRQRLADEYRSATLFSQYQSLLLLANLPIDVLGCAARMVQDEVRHVALCADLVTALGGTPDAAIDAGAIYLAVDPTAAVLPQLVDLTIGLFCLGETASAALIDATRQAATAPVVREVLARLHRDEVFHAEFGWHLLSLLLDAPDAPSREDVAARLAPALAQLEAICTGYGPEVEASAFDAADHALGSLGPAEHRAAFHLAVERDLLPRFERLGVAAQAAWAARGPAH